MSEQRYAIVPVEPTSDMVMAGQCYVGLHRKFVEMVKRAPPPPESVLTQEEIKAIYHFWLRIPGHANEFDLIHLVERAVLQRLQGESRG